MRAGAVIQECSGCTFNISVEDVPVGIEVYDSPNIVLQSGHFRNVKSPVKVKRSPNLVARNLVDYGCTSRPPPPVPRAYLVDRISGLRGPRLTLVSFLTRCIVNGSLR